MEESEPKSSEPVGSPFVDALVADLHPVRPASALPRSLATWLPIVIATVTGLILATGPLRPGNAGPLMTERLWLEVTAGLLAAVALIAAGLELGVPGRPRLSRLLLPAAAGVALFCAFVLAGGTLLPGLEGPVPSMAGKREHCFIEGLMIGVIPAFLLVLRLPARALSAGAPAGALLGAGAAMLPAIGMQIACMYDAEHALHFHLPPILIIGTGAALLGAWLMRNR